MDLRGRVVVITGASRGLGFLLAREFAREGCKLVLCARHEDELAEAGRLLEKDGAQVATVVCDVSHPDEVKHLIVTAIDRFGGIDVLVNNAGIIQVGPIESLTLEDFRAAMDVIYWGALHATLATLPHMQRRRSGRIVNITSIGGKVAIPHLLPYDAAKFALVGLSEGLRTELGKDGIAVTTIVPGLMRTGSALRAGFTDERESAWFMAGAATPLTAMDARRAARRIVQATRRGQAEVTLSAQAKVLSLAHALAPSAVMALLGLVTRHVLRRQLRPVPFITRLLRGQALRSHQLAGGH